jgi:PAS domain S-box-containing protein
MDSIDLSNSDDTNEYESLLEKLPVGVVIHHEGVIAFANSNAHAIIGADKPGALIGLNAFNFVHPDFLPGIVERIKRVVAGQSAPMVEEKFVRMDGQVIDVETMGFPFTYKGKATVQVIFRDITEKKRAEAKIRLNETLFTQLFENIPMAVVMLDETGKVAEINRGFETMFGFDKEELKGKNLNNYIVPEELQNEGIDLNNLIASNQVVSIESIRKHRSGRGINVILYGVPVMQDHQVIGIYGAYVDITGRKKVEEELKVRNAELDNFVYKISHDLRAPLSSVLGLVNLSKVQGNNDNLLMYMELIGEKILALDNFIGDVLSHSKNLKMEVDISRVGLQQIIEQTFTDLGYLSGAGTMKRTVKIDGIDFYSDQWRVAEILRNLISNAIKYRRPQANDSEIIIKIHVDHLCADISFIDNGIGIRDASLKRIFEMFYRATDQGGGSGIGLYIVKNAVEKLGGQIKVASSPGYGTRFHILLPNRINSTLGSSGIVQEGS